MPSTAMQFDLFGGTRPPQDLDLQAKVAFVLENHPETRDDDRLLTLWYWAEWHGLCELLTPEQFDALLEWSAFVEKPETIRRRRQEIQILRSGVGTMQPSATVAAARRERDSAGPPRRKRRR